MTEAPKLTLATIRTMEPGATLWCHVVTGLHVRRRATKYTWNYYYKAHSGARRSLTLGQWPSMTVEAARELARDYQTRVARGDDPSSQKQNDRARPTVEALAAQYFAAREPELAEITLAGWRGTYRLHAAPYLNRLYVADVTTPQIQSVLDRCERTAGPGAARVLRAVLSGMFNYASSSAVAYRQGSPVADTRALPDTERERAIQPDEFERVAAELEAERERHPWHVAVLWCVLYTGSRITEMATARHDQIADGVLRLEKHKTRRKTGKPRLITLPEPARAELAALPSSNSPYLFPPIAELRQPKASVWYVWTLVRERAGVPDIQPRDLRRTWASTALSSGYNLDQIAGPLGHRKGSAITQRYAHLFKSTGSAMVEDVASAIKDLAKGAKP